MQVKDVKNNGNAVMKQRCSIRVYDPSVKISREEIEKILQDAMTAPSSLNLQPWRFVVVNTPEGKELLKPFMSFNQQQLETCSAMIAVFGDLQFMSNAEKIYSAAVEKGLMTPEHSQMMLGVINGAKQNIPAEAIKDGILADCGLVIMQLMLAAKAYGYDTNPIGGYDKGAVTKALGMDTSRYIPVLLVSIGKAAEEKHDSIRFSVNEVTQWK
ncbi:MAG: nitroreductase family protein [Bacteroidales bacterium]|jgi:nitroreductase|nr:nitroreductase family protein [Bacteroidales bacterium]